MPTLNNNQKRDIIAKEKTTSGTKILDYILKYDNLSLDDFPQMDPSKRAWIEQEIQKRPNPNEVGEWQTIQQFIVPAYTAIDTSALSQLHDKLSTYLHKWDPIRPNGNHVDEAQTEYNKVQNELNDRMQQSSDNEWPALNKGDKQALTDFLRRYPITNHKDEIDDYLWDLIDRERKQDLRDYILWDLIDRERKQDLRDYISLFPNGQHTNDAQDILADIQEWERTDKRDIYSVQNYIDNHSNSQYISVAQEKLDELKESIIDDMRNAKGNYDADKLLQLIESKIFSEQDLEEKMIVMPGTIESLRDPNILRNLDLEGAITRCRPICRKGYTDVYFFGVPTTGKTCVLMGLTSSKALDINATSSGGDYADQLRLYNDIGRLLPPTQGTFTTTIEGKMYAPGDISYGVNLIEMSGEQFVEKIAKNPDGAVSFVDMGGDVATKLLQNENRKVFFLIIDPTTDKQVINIDGKNVTISQMQILEKMIHLFEENEEIMERVDSLHFIVTKADTLAESREERRKKAMDIFNACFSEHTLTTIKDLCKDKNINSNSSFCPRLYTFSLGTFIIHDYFFYDKSDAVLLAAAIRNSAQRTKKKSWWDMFKKMVNKQLI